MEIARTLEWLLDTEEERLTTTDSVEAVLRILLDRKDGMFRARIALSDGSLRATAAGEGAMPALAVSDAAMRLDRRLRRR